MRSKKYVMENDHYQKMSLHERILLWWHKRKLRMIVIITIVFVLTMYYRNNMANFGELKHKENKNELLVPLAIPIVGKIEPTSDPSKSQATPIISSTYNTSSEKKLNVPKAAPNLPSEILFSKPIEPCKMFSCFNHGRCNITGGFPVYLYDLMIPYPVTNRITSYHLRQMLSSNYLLTTDPISACIYVALVGEYSYSDKSNMSKVSHKFSNESTLRKLRFWRRAGRNHVLINLAQTRFPEDSGDAILAQTTFKQNHFRPGFDVVIPPIFGPISGDVWAQITPISTPKRRFILSFQGVPAEMKSSQHLGTLIRILSKLGKTRTQINGFYIQFQCEIIDKKFDPISDWSLCGNRESRRKLLRKSTFVLIITPDTHVSTYLLQTRLFEALESGAIPVVLGGDRIHLPYEEVLDWRKAVISLSIYRVTELRLVLSTISYEDILAFRRQGRMLWERYLGSMQVVLDTLLGVIRSRLNIPPRPISPMFASVQKYETPNITKVGGIPSKCFKRNFTVGLLNGYEQWNVWGDPFVLYPHLPWDPINLPKPRFVDWSVKPHFHKSCNELAGDYPVEQFTVVLLTYDRPTMLSHALDALSAMPYLNKIIVVSNGPKKPSMSDWPKTGAPIVLVRGKRNSLNNRFLPYHLIETEAVFSVDDDAVPMTKDIYFAFKVWREHRDQIVGFFGRNYEWDTKKNKGFTYSNRYKKRSKKTNIAQLCEVSMVLTGAAFIHRYYMWAYWRILPQAMRDYVDELMNCEDIAMNFLVSHITRKPPVKPAAQGTMQSNSSGSYRKLSHSKYHYRDRHKCLQFFTKVMGYNPLLTTHFRLKSFRKMPLDEQF
ncbi:exostosin-3-like [Plodia interpunctella]|uniref:exostosin-3-like n=1 Tax=Plodia interpunctella TaxID=58824 RepID=UPI002367EE29|nr:exostosin-3-like [Plodia interpunctella]